MPYARAPGRSVTAATSGRARRDSLGTSIGHEPARDGSAPDEPAAGWIGAIAANAPDWSELVLKPDLWPPRAGGEYLVFHRGITHSFVGAAVEAAVLTGLVGVLLRLWARRAMVPAPLWRWVA